MRVIWTRILLITSTILVLIQGSPQLLYANRKDIRLVDAGRPESNSSVLASGLDDAAAVDFLYSDQMIFWTDITLTVILQGWVNGPRETVEVISSGLVSPDGLAVDWLGRKIYWTDSETNLIEVSNLDGSYRKVLCWEDIDQPRAIALHPEIGYLWWTDWGESPKIERAGMDGDPETRSTIISDNIYWPNGLTIDYVESRLYWADAKLAFIHSCNYDGSDRRTVVDGSLPHPFSLTLYENSLYWTDWQTKAIHTCDKLTGENRSVVFKHSNTNSPMDIHIYSAKRQPAGANPCGDNNGGCSHLCLMSPTAPFYSCACPTGVQLTDDKKTCAKGAKEILLLARRSDLRRISLDTPDYTDVVLQLEDVRHAIAIDYDPVDGYVYWTDDEERAIQRAYINGTGHQDFVPQVDGQEIIVGAEVEHPDGLAVDWVARNLYWTDTGTDRIEVSRLNGSSRRVLISENLDEPRAIVLDPVRGYMYWTDWGEEPKIERANLDGSDRIALVNTSIGWPNGLALDFMEKKLYWGDAQTDKIEVINMDGSGRKVLVDESLPHIFGFSLLGDYLYWTDWQSRSIYRANKHTGRGKESIIEQLPDLMGLKAVDVTRIEGTNGCAEENGGCSHLCLNRPQPKGPICACPMGLELVANGKVCIVPEAFLLFSHRTDIRRISLETGHNNMVLPLAGVKEATCLDFDINDNRIYWTDTSLKSISRAFMNGSSLEHIVKHGLAYPEGMAVDWVAHNLYWADPGFGRHKMSDYRRGGEGRIEMSRMDGSARKVLIWKDVEPRAIALDPPKGYMYWSDWRNGGQIERAALDGTLRTPLVTKIGRVMGLTIDFSERKLYWTNVDSKDIECADLDGSNRDAVLHGLPYPFGLTQYEDYLYWTDWETKSIEKANKTNGLNRTRIQDSLEYIMDISVFHASRQSGENACGVSNGGCSHLCVAHSIESSSHFTHHCACPTHYTLDRNNHTCKPPDTFLMYSQKTSICRILMGTNDDPDIVLPINNLKNVKALSYDPAEGNIYWLDGKTKTIKYAKDNGSNVQTVLPRHPQDLFQPYDFAIDPYARQIYWTDQKTNVINVTGLDGKVVGIVMNKPNQKPRDIVLAPEYGLMFWINLGKPANIERAAMDGTEAVTVVNSVVGTGGITLAIDVQSRKIFWADIILKRIESADFDGGNHRVLADRQIQRPVGLAVLGSQLYWVDKERNLLEGMNKVNGSGRASQVSRVDQLSDIHAVRAISTAALRAHPCGINNGGCTHLCMATDKSSRCSCPVGLSLADDMKTCTEPPTCASDQFTCAGGKSLCVPALWRCDGVAECDDGSDEQGCSTCSEQHFHCRDGQCVTNKSRCDLKADCADGSDEEWCAPCEDGFFECSGDHVCVVETRKCDGKPDCAKGEDEVDCDYTHGAMQHTVSDSTTQYTIIVVVGLLVTMTILVVLVFACRKKHQHQLLEDQCAGTGDVKVVFTKLLNNPVVTLKGSSPPHTLPRGSGGSKTSGSGLPYDRDHVTGASSSSSAVTQYPQETLNPPPSPVTDRSQCAGSQCADSQCAGSQCADSQCAGTGELYSPSPSTVRSYRPPPSRHKHRAPHTTPCSTDVCEDSEPYPPLRGSQPYPPLRGSSQRNKKQYYSDRYYHNPPPTPARSNYFSDDPSFPPSPSTERSFFNPYNPPPSPVDTSDC